MAIITRVLADLLGNVIVIHADTAAKTGEQTDTEYLDSIVAEKYPTLTGQPYKDGTPADLPDTSIAANHPEKWEWDAGEDMGIAMNSTETSMEKRQAVLDAIDTELAKGTPDAVKVAKYQQMITKSDYDLYSVPL